jgi:uncharacterized protein YeaO (DUF488 family)
MEGKTGILMINIKRIYEVPDDKDGFRILVDRIWPRGLKKEDAKLDKWMKEVAPTTALRKWFNHEPEKWPAFEQRYQQELKENKAVHDLMDLVKKNKKVTLLYGAKNETCNQAIVLQQYLTAKI